eukprot:5996513-Prymnesium_polylepis.1
MVGAVGDRTEECPEKRSRHGRFPSGQQEGAVRTRLTRTRTRTHRSSVAVSSERRGWSEGWA